jgi:hypothetical protein
MKSISMKKVSYLRVILVLCAIEKNSGKTFQIKKISLNEDKTERVCKESKISVKTK